MVISARSDQTSSKPLEYSHFPSVDEGPRRKLLESYCHFREVRVVNRFEKYRSAFIKKNAAILTVSTSLMVALAFQNCGKKANEDLAASSHQNSGITDQALMSATTIVNLSKKNKAIHAASANPNGQPVIRLDRDGHAVDAHDGEIKRFGSKYYLYGTSYSCGFEYLSQGTKPFCGFKSYSSTDLVHWDDEGLLFPPSLLATACSANGCFRPHVLFNSKTGRYVLWINVSEGGVGYRVFTASSPTGPFTMVNASPKLLRPSGGGDHNLFLDDDGTAYLIYSNYGMATEAFKIVIEKLNSEFTDSTGIYARFPNGGEGETLFKRGNTYYVVFDGGCAYCPNGTTHYGTAPSPLGPWTYRGSLSSDSCGGQSSHVQKFGDEYLYMSDLWYQNKPYEFKPEIPAIRAILYKNQSRAAYYWAPLSFDSAGAIAPIVCNESMGNVFLLAAGNQKAIGNADQTSGDAGFSEACDVGSAGDQVRRMQIFRPSVTGTLSEIHLNLFRGGLDGSEVAQQDLMLDVIQMNPGSQPGPVLTTQILTWAGVELSSRKMTVRPNVQMTAEKDYAFVLRSNLAANGKACWGFAYSDDDPYSRGKQMKSENRGQSYSEEVGRDLRFTTVMIPGPGPTTTTMPVTTTTTSAITTTTTMSAGNCNLYENVVKVRAARGDLVALRISEARGYRMNARDWHLLRNDGRDPLVCSAADLQPGGACINMTAELFLVRLKQLNGVARPSATLGDADPLPALIFPNTTNASTIKVRAAQGDIAARVLSDTFNYRMDALPWHTLRADGRDPYICGPADLQPGGSCIDMLVGPFLDRVTLVNGVLRVSPNLSNAAPLPNVCPF